MRWGRDEGLKGFWRDRRGSVSPMLVLLMIPLVGALSMAVEASSWFLTQRALQNAADSAVIAAANNACASGGACDQTYPFYNVEARSVAAKFGFQNGVADTTVSAVNGVTCPSGATNCYQVTITKKVPVYLTRLVGFQGDTTTSAGVRAQLVSATAIASGKTSPTAYCMTALGSSESAIEVNGAPELGSDCSLLAPNGGASCTNQGGAKIKYADVAKPAKNSKTCGTERTPPVDFTDNFRALANQIPSKDLCGGSYPQDGKKTPLPSSNTPDATTTSFSGSTPKCGDVKLADNITITSDSVLVIHNGNLDLNNKTLQTAAGAHLTIVFSGDNSGSYGHVLKGGGTLDIAAPTSGAWSGVAIYQDPTVTGGTLDFTYAGSSPDLNVTGLVYAPNAKITISGAIDHHTAGNACISFMAREISVGGTVAIFASPTRECDRAGLVLPGSPASSMRATLVR